MDKPESLEERARKWSVTHPDHFAPFMEMAYQHVANTERRLIWQAVEKLIREKEWFAKPEYRLEQLRSLILGDGNG